jgi:hypothetical protein
MCSGRSSWGSTLGELECRALVKFSNCIAMCVGCTVAVIIPITNCFVSCECLMNGKLSYILFKLALHLKMKHLENPILSL